MCESFVFQARVNIYVLNTSIKRNISLWVVISEKIRIGSISIMNAIKPGNVADQIKADRYIYVSFLPSI